MKRSVFKENILRCLFIFTVFLVSCQDTGHHDLHTNKKTPSGKTKINTKPPSGYSDTVIINAAAAVFYIYDSLQLQEIKAITDTMIFESMVHDCFYQMRNARLVIQKNYPAIRIIEVKKARFLLFEYADGKKECIDLDAQNDACGIFLFDTHKKPLFTDMTNIDSELGFYF